MLIQIQTPLIAINSGLQPFYSKAWYFAISRANIAQPRAPIDAQGGGKESKVLSRSRLDPCKAPRAPSYLLSTSDGEILSQIRI